MQAAVKSAADDLRQHEHIIRQRAGALETLQQRQRATLDAWQARRSQVGASVSALVRLAAVPPAGALIQDAGTVERLRSAFVLRGLIPRLQGRAELLRRDLAAIRKAATDVAAVGGKHCRGGEFMLVAVVWPCIVSRVVTVTTQV